MKKVIIAVLALVLLLSSSIGATTAFFVDNVTSARSTASSGTIDVEQHEKTHNGDFFPDKVKILPGNKVTKTVGGGSTKLTTEGTYEINTADDGSMTITFTWSDGDVKTESSTEIEVNGEKSIKIGLVTFTKE